MSEKKKRIPPWEAARLVFQQEEERRKRKLMQADMKVRQTRAIARAKRPGPFDELEANRKRLADIKKRLQEEEGKG